VPGVTGVLVAEQDEEAFAAGLGAALDGRLSPTACRANAERFSMASFRERFGNWVTTSAALRGISLSGPVTQGSV
jgi:hypothetical protein